MGKGVLGKGVLEKGLLANGIFCVKKGLLFVPPLVGVFKKKLLNGLLPPPVDGKFKKLSLPLLENGSKKLFLRFALGEVKFCWNGEFMLAGTVPAPEPFCGNPPLFPVSGNPPLLPNAPNPPLKPNCGKPPLLPNGERPLVPIGPNPPPLLPNGERPLLPFRPLLLNEGNSLFVKKFGKFNPPPKTSLEFCVVGAGVTAGLEEVVVMVSSVGISPPSSTSICLLTMCALDRSDDDAMNRILPRS